MRVSAGVDFASLTLCGVVRLSSAPANATCGPPQGGKMVGVHLRRKKHHSKDFKPWMDPTPKRNRIFEPLSGQSAPDSTPEKKLGWENRKARDPKVGHQTVSDNNNNNNNNHSHSF